MQRFSNLVALIIGAQVDLMPRISLQPDRVRAAASQKTALSSVTIGAGLVGAFERSTRFTSHCVARHLVIVVSMVSRGKRPQAGGCKQEGRKQASREGHHDE